MKEAKIKDNSSKLFNKFRSSNLYKRSENELAKKVYHEDVTDIQIEPDKLQQQYTEEKTRVRSGKFNPNDESE